MKENHIQLEKVRAQSSQFSYTDVMMNIKLLAVVTPPSIYHGCSTWKTFWEEKFTCKENFTLGEFSAMNMKDCGCFNIMKQGEIKGSDKYVNLDTLLKCDSIENMKITSSESKGNLRRSGKRLINSLGIKDKAGPKQGQQNTKRQGIQFGNVSKKDPSKIIRDFEKITYESYERKRPKCEPTDS